MTRRKRKNTWRPETIAIGVLVLIFFTWAIAKVDVLSKAKGWFADEEPTTTQVAAIDSLQVKLDELRPIYITIDNLKLRTDPTLKSSVLKKLPLHERVYFTGVISDSTTTINIGRTITKEPWVKVIMEDGQEGWLYGAGVHFYKTENLNSLISN